MTKRGEFRITAGWSRHADESGRRQAFRLVRASSHYTHRTGLSSELRAHPLSAHGSSLSLRRIVCTTRAQSLCPQAISGALRSPCCAPVRASPPGSRSLPVPSRLPLHNSKVGMLSVSPLSSRASSPCLLHAPSVPMVARCIQCHTSQLAAHQRARARHSAESVNRLLGDRTAWGVTISHELLLHPVVVGAVLTAADELNEVLVMGNDHELGGGEGGGHRATR